MIHRSRVLLPVSLIAGAVLWAGCGTSSPSAASSASVSAKSPVTPKAVVSHKISNQWHVVGTLSAQEIGKEPGVRHLWLLTQLPATANHEAEYVGQSVSTTSKSVTTVTPPFLPPDNRTETAWGRTPQGLWWITFVSQSNIVRTAIWQPGRSEWTRLPNLTINPPSSNDATTPTLTVVRGRQGHGWMVSNYSGESGGAQTIVYGLHTQGWQVVHTFPLASSSQASNITWETPGPIGSLYVNPQGPDNPVTISRHGTILKTIPIPLPLAKHWGQYVLINGVHVVMSNTGVSYAIGNTLWQWQGSAVHSLIPTGSTLSNDGYTWLGFWQNQPVVSEDNANALFLYHHGQWISANALTRPDSSSTPLWKHDTLWSISNNTGQIWTKSLSSTALP